MAEQKHNYSPHYRLDPAGKLVDARVYKCAWLSLGMHVFVSQVMKAQRSVYLLSQNSSISKADYTANKSTLNQCNTIPYELVLAMLNPLPGVSERSTNPIGDPWVGADCQSEIEHVSEGNE